MTRSLSELVKPGYESIWEKEIYPKFFVRNPDDINQCRTPGLFKEEAIITNGSMICLRFALKL